MKTLFFFFITFPLSAQIRGVVKDSISGEPIPYVNIWVDGETIGTISELPAEYRDLLQSELSLREFVPVIQRVLSVSGKTEPCEWVVDTNHGRTTFVLKSEEDVHRISTQTVNILDANGMRYRVENLNALDRKSKAFIEWYV
jgi:hypothetical protein